MRFFGTKTAAAALALGLVAAPVAFDGTPQAALAQAEQFTDRQVQAFATAATEVSKISQKWMERIEDADSQAQSAQLREQANAEMIQAIEGENLNVDTYNRIYQTAQQDPALARRVEQEIQAQN